MFRTFVSLVSLVLLGQLMICVQPAYANSKAEKQLPFAEKVRAIIAELGVGKDARVTVKLKDKTKDCGVRQRGGSASNNPRQHKNAEYLKLSIFSSRL